MLGDEYRFKGLICAQMKCICFAAGDVIHSSIPSLNPIGNSIGYVARGNILWKSPIHTTILSRGDSFGELSGVLGVDCGVLSVVAETNATLFVVAATDLKRILSDWKVVEEPLVQLLTEREQRHAPDYIRHDDQDLVQLRSQIQKNIIVYKDTGTKFSDEKDVKDDEGNDTVEIDANNLKSRSIDVAIDEDAQ
mmetsp:Transcript_29122/g.40609  ORF Transcript_29122/g.40609 Transcript_29122/m.40609 type:complete len:193 (+) Transcript_29122:769-1347(+)|eukprot:CAMPEP_0185282132 /NCGR_PEP_ID=MMETSP1359-20130426/67103_1 /TAXON_ID=552665 /ORGANISM="Bigelowiella longifila, Strain CCMP242" /LENGTH=192 /DNA_ID=CAMNT_0027877639 /DNA_START=1210 /DNA_END=1788 /DNA_ORIENTATION=+